MKRFVLIVAASILAVSLSAQSGLGLTFGNYSITSIQPQSFSSVKGSVSLEVTNASTPFTLSQIRGAVYKNGRRFVEGTADDIFVAKGESRLSISGVASLCEGVGLLDVLRCFYFDVNDYSIDISLVYTRDGHSVPVEKKNIPLSSFLKR